MKKVFLTLLISAAFTASFAQTSKAIVMNGSAAQIGDFDPSSSTFSNSQPVGYFESNFKPSDFIYDAKNGHAIYQDKTTGLVFSSISGNKITSKNFGMNTTVMAPAYVPSTETIICFKVQKEFNGYGSNEENLFLSKIDVNKGTSKNIMQFKDLSFDNVSAPFYGKITIQNNMGGPRKEVEKEVAISKPLYIADKDLYIVLIKDVTGTNRLYKIHVNSPTANISSNRCDYNIIDMTYAIGTDVAKTLFFEGSGTDKVLKVGDLNLTTNAMTNIAAIANFSSTEINNGSIKFNTDHSQLFVSRFDGVKTNIYSIDINDNQKNSEVAYPGNIQFDFGFNESYYKPITYASVFGLYPNPSTGIVNFKNNSGILPNSIKVYDNVGQLIRSIAVEEITPQISIDLSGMATGIYHVKVDMPGEDFIGKVAVTN